MPDKEVIYVPVDPKAFGYAWALGCLVEYFPILIGISVVLGVIMFVTSLPGMIGDMIEKSKNPDIEKQYTAEITTVITQVLPPISDSLRSLTTQPGLQQYFTGDAYKGFGMELHYLQEQNEFVDQNIAILGPIQTRWLSARMMDLEKMSETKYACASFYISGTRTIKNDSGTQPETIQAERMSVGLIRENNQWHIIEMSEKNIYFVNSYLSLLSYC